MKLFSAAHLSHQAWSSDSLPADGAGREIAFAGRSNVGKSSLLNCIVNRRRLARVSKTPGRTRQAYFYCLPDDEKGEKRYLVDLPGYGYARGAGAESEKWGLIVAAILKRKSLMALVWLLDIRHAPVEADKKMKIWLEQHVGSWVKVVPVMTKCDKLSKRASAEAVARVRSWLNEGNRENNRYEQPFPVSSLNRQGMEPLMKRLSLFLS